MEQNEFVRIPVQTLPEAKKEYEECVVLLKEWEKFCDEQSRLHDASRSYYKKLNYNIAIPAILLSTIGGTANIGISGNECSDKHDSDADSYKRWLPVVFGSIGLFSAALFTIHRYMSIPELQKEHDFYSDEYAKLFNEIKMQLFICNSPHKTYINLTEFTKSCKRTLDVLVDKEPPIPGKIRKKVLGTEEYRSNAAVRSKMNPMSKKTAKSIPSLTLFKSPATRNPNISLELGEIPDRQSNSSSSPRRASLTDKQ